MTQENQSYVARSPIADLTYRNYDGPLHTRRFRWWIVALATLRRVMKGPGFWIVAGLAMLPYLIAGLILYFQFASAETVVAADKGHRFALIFFQTINTTGWEGLMLFCIAIMAGAGSIAADNKANAMLVYFSKPITKGDYLLGKWMGIFLLLFAVALVPALVLYLYCLVLFFSQGFLRNEPWLIFKVILASTIPGIVHSSLIVGFSAWSKTPRMASAVYSGLYFITGIFAPILVATQIVMERSHALTPQQNLIMNLSINGIIMGLVQNVYSVHIGQRGIFDVPPPPLWPLLAIAGALCGLGILAARSKIRAVEVVRG